MARALLGELTASGYRHGLDAQPAAPMRHALGAYPALMEGAIPEALARLHEANVSGFTDPEGWYLSAFWLVRAGAVDPAIEYLTRAVDGGYACHEPLTRQPDWALLRGDPRFEPLVERTASIVADARVRFTRAGGEAVLGDAPCD